MQAHLLVRWSRHCTSGHTQTWAMRMMPWFDGVRFIIAFWEINIGKYMVTGTKTLPSFRRKYSISSKVIDKIELATLIRYRLH